MIDKYKNCDQEIRNEFRSIDLKNYDDYYFVYSEGKQYKHERKVLMYSKSKKRVCFANIKDIRNNNDFPFMVVYNIKDYKSLLNSYTVLNNHLVLYERFKCYGIDDFRKDFPHSGLDIYDKYLEERISLYIDLDRILFIILYLSNPEIEQLVKVNFQTIINSYLSIEQGIPFEAGFSSGKTISKITGLKKWEWKELLKVIMLYGNWPIAKNFIKEYKPNKDQLEMLCEIDKESSKNGIYSVTLFSIIDEILKQSFMGKRLYSLKSLLSYIVSSSEKNKVGRFLDELFDYNKMCIELGEKPKNKPKYLYKEHDLIAKKHKIFTDKQSQEKYNSGLIKRYEHLKRFQYEDDNYIVYPPIDYMDFTHEAEENHNCVSTYIVDHIKGNTSIFFMRKKTNPDHSYITIELDEENNRIVQAYKAYNSSIDNDEEEAFLKKWIQYVQERMVAEYDNNE